ncbi:DNA binding domain-containing protein, excisionase family [Actinobaculum suis]|uniref:DNA binding domain, excisionase family n=1 Tax=Actinobaculum suis TaxID=1657 RepID=A0A0K9ES28_9ACTO|nr:helix-turn-helix domain-containing protein [Actinobaculum suis]KMY22984.1 excisionase [Actinobaculum suis]MDY5152956.1 helix-turn-helix domain-containing protein [Actinobaculum suis]OCA94602.1 excisionase [Actinobaculum suis]OCA95013.1 excisionase [Actinobaculum suis]SDE36753.1 DNA binding domain-containing protein, excisionase family [Actinobaculum suis]
MSKFLTIADVADYLSVSAGQVRTLIKNGEIPAIQVGGRGQWRIEESVLADYVERGYAATRERVEALHAERSSNTKA